MNTPNRPGAIKREDCKNKIRAQVSLISRTHARIMASEMTHRVEFEIKHTSNAKLEETLLWPRLFQIKTWSASTAKAWTFTLLRLAPRELKWCPNDIRSVLHWRDFWGRLRVLSSTLRDSENWLSLDQTRTHYWAQKKKRANRPNKEKRERYWGRVRERG